MLIENREITELYNLKHFNDNYEKGFDYQSKMLRKSVSGNLYDNPNMSGFLDKLNGMVVMMFEQVTIFRNLKSFFIDKYYNDHIN